MDGVKKACWVLALHPFSVSTEFDGVFMACRAQALHPFSVSTEFDGVFMACRVQALHPFSVSTEFDGMKKACLAQTIHPITPSAISDGITPSAISDGAPVQKCSNSLHPSAHLTKSDGASSRNAQIHYIHLRFQPYPMEDLLRNAQIRYIHLRTRPNPMERPHMKDQIRWGARNLQQKTSSPRYPGAGSKTSYHQSQINLLFQINSAVFQSFCHLALCHDIIEP